MNAAAEFQFLQPLWLALLAPLWLLIWIHARRGARASAWQRFCDPHLLAAMSAGRQRQARRAGASWILGGVLSIGIIAAAAPSWSRLSYPIMEASSARVIVVDLSRSMLVQDVRPSRYQHALAAASEIIANDFAGETGLLVFARSAFVLSPLSRDADSLQAFIEAVHPDIMPRDGSNLAHAIESAGELLSASLSGHGQILLITAGDSLEQTAVQAAIDAVARGSRVSVLAIGSDAGGPLLDPEGGLLRDDNGQVRISRTNFELLQRIATAGKGRLLVTGAGDYNLDLLGSSVESGALIEAQHAAEQSAREASDDGAWLVWLMLAPALLLFRRNLLWILLIAVVLPLDQEALASGEPGFWRHRETLALDAYRRGDYAIALETSDSPLLRGASYYRSGLFVQALEQFGRLDSAAALYNQANALVQLQRYPEAIAAYRRALDLEPALLDARYNLRLLERFVRQQADSAADADSGASHSGDPAEDPAAGETSEMRIGIATELQVNPADQQRSGSGFGAAQQPGQVDPLERFDGSDANQGRFVLRAQSADRLPSPQTIERWISALPQTSTELYRRKFLRDYLRQQQPQR